MTETTPFEILLAEDNPADVELVREALKEHGVSCSVRVIPDGAQAIEFFSRMDTDDSKAVRLDLVLLDICLPKRNGEEVLKHLRSTERYARTPVIVMTGLSRGGVEDTAMGQSGTMYFEKPTTLYEFLQLGALVRDALEGRAATPDSRAFQKAAV